MRPLALLAVLACACVVFSGCAGTGNGKASPSSTSSTSSSHASSSSSSTSASNGTGNATNHAPTGTLAVLVNGTGASFNLTGGDSDGDNLTWTLAFGDGNATNGTALPAALNHTYAPGNYSANFTLRDGKAATSYTAAINASAASSGTATAMTFTGTVYAPDPVAASQQDNECLFALMTITFGQPPSGKGLGDYHSFAGQVLDNAKVAVTPSGMLWQFLTGSSYDGDHNAATVPAGSDGFLICSSTAVDANYTVTITP